ncbi:hypothetical protein, partial [Microvirga makkahensis]
MSQHPDLTIPPDASVVDEEVLRVLRAVQRSLPQGDGGSDGHLVGGIATAAMFGMVQGDPHGGGAPGSSEAAREQSLHAIRSQDEPLRRLDIPQPGRMTILPDSLVSAPSLDPTPKALSRSAASYGSSGAAPQGNTAASMPEETLIGADTPPEQPVVVTPPPMVDIPEIVPDPAADVPLAMARDVSGEEDTAIALDLAARLADLDGSEVLAISLLDVPDGAKLSHGWRAPDGSWSVDPADLPHLTLTPPPDFSGPIELTLRVSAQAKNGSAAVTESPFVVQVAAVADAPDVTVADAQGREDAPVALRLTAALADTDGSEVLSVTILGVPEGALLSHGTQVSAGTWVVSPADLEHLSLTPPRDFSGTIALTIRATSRETSNKDEATVEAEFQVRVDAVADAPRVMALDVAGREDEPIGLDLSAALADTDGSEELSTVTITGIPAGAFLSHGSRASDGGWVVDPADLPHLVLTPPENYSGILDLTARVTSRESASGSASTTEVPFKVRVSAVADKPEIRAENVAGKEDDAIPLKLDAKLTDTDGSEVLSVTILNVPEGASLSHGTQISAGTWIVAPADLADLRMTPPKDFSGTMNLTLEALARESSNGSVATSRTSFRVQVDAVPDAPDITAGSARGNEDSTIPLNLSTKVGDKDGSEEISSVIISGVPDGFVLTCGTRISEGTWRIGPADLPHVAIVPPENASGTFDLTITATAREKSNGLEESSSKTFQVHVEAVPDQPGVSAQDASGREDAAITLDISAALADTDGSEVLSIVIRGLPKGTQLSAGQESSDGSWALTPAELSGLRMTPPAHWSGDRIVTVEAWSRETSNGAEATNSTTFRLQVEGVADAPSVTARNVSGHEDKAISLNLKASLVDADGSETLSVIVSGVPDGAVLSHGTPLADGNWSVKASDVSKLKLTPPRDFSGDIKLTVHATSAEGNGDTASTEKSLVVTVKPVADEPEIHAEDVAGKEDDAIPLKLDAKLTDTDGSEVLSVTILGVPEGALLSHGTQVSAGTWVVSPADLEHLSLTPPRDFSGTIALTIRATSRETSNKDEATVEAEFQVRVDAVADAPGLRVSPSVGNEDTPIPLHVGAWTTDRDGSESIVGFRLADVPDGAIVTAGGIVLEREADGSILVMPDVIHTLSITPPSQSDGDFTLRVSAISAEPNGSEAESAPMDLPVTVRAVADASTFTSTSASGLEDKAIALHLEAATLDGDRSETITFVISNVPPGAVLSEGTYRGTGIWSLTAEEAARVTLLPPPDYSGTIELTVAAISQERNGGDQAVTRIAFPVHVQPVVDTPAVGGLDADLGNWGTMNGLEDQPIRLVLDPGLSDRDGSEAVVGDILIGNVPETAVLKLADGTVIEASPDGLYRVPAAQMEGVTLTMPPNSDDKVTLTIEMTVEDSGGDPETIRGHMVVDPLGDADSPTLELGPSNGTGHDSIDADDGWIALQIAADTTDKDGSETLHMLVRDVPPGASLSAGSPVGNGVWLVPVESLSGLSIRPPAGWSGTFDLTVTAIAVEREGDQHALSEPLTVTVTAPDGSGGGGDSGGGTGGDGGSAPVPKAAQPPVLAVSDAITNEDSRVELSIEAATADSDDGAEFLGVRIQGVPEDARLSAGIRDSETGDWLLRPSDLANVELIPPPDFSGTITLTVQAIAQEATGDQSVTVDTLDIVVTPVADSADIEVSPSAGVEDQPILLDLGIRPGDSDGSEIVTAILLSGLTDGARIADGPGITDNGDGTWTIDPAHLADIRVLPPADGYGRLEITVEVTTRETANGHTTTTSKIIAIDVAPEADLPTVVAHDASGGEDGRIELNLSASLNDTDGSEVLSIVIDGLPAGTRLSAGLNNGDGSWTLTPEQLSDLAVIPPADWSGTMDLTVLAHARERSNGSVATSRTSLEVRVEAEADVPLAMARDVSGEEDTAIALDLAARLADLDGSEVLAISLLDVPDGAKLSHGWREPDGSWSVDPADLPHLTLTPPPDFSGPIELTLRVSSREENGSTAVTESPFVVQVTAEADAPDVTVADAQGREDAPVRLDGLGGSLRDGDGSETLRFELSGVPEGATLSAGTDLGGGCWALTEAQLSGLTLTPPPDASGTYTLTLEAIATERAGGPSARTSASFTLTLDPVADEGTITGSAAGGEDQWIALQPAFTTPDQDGSESWSATTTVSGLPAGAVLSQGRETETGVWEVSTAALQAGEVALLPPPNSDARFSLTLTATLRDEANGASDSRVVSSRVDVTVTAEADAPDVTVADAQGREDAPVALRLTAALADTDGSEVLSVTILGVPE